MRIGVIVSILVHIALLAWALYSVTATQTLASSEDVPLQTELISIGETSNIRQGDKNAKTEAVKGEKDKTKQTEKPVKAKNDRVALAAPTKKEEVVTKEIEKKEEVKVEEPKKEEPKVEPKKEEPKPEPKKEEVKKEEPKKEEAAAVPEKKKEEPKKEEPKKAEKKPEPKKETKAVKAKDEFDPDKIAVGGTSAGAVMALGVAANADAPLPGDQGCAGAGTSGRVAIQLNRKPRCSAQVWPTALPSMRQTAVWYGPAPSVVRKLAHKRPRSSFQRPAWISLR